MSDYNHIVLVGHLGKDPEVFRNGSKPPFAKVQLATNKSWKKDGQKFSKTEWHTVVFNRKLAELAEKHLHKGDRILVTGELSSQKWQDKDGNKRLSVFAQAKELRFLSPKAKTAEVDEQSDVTVTADIEEESVYDTHF